MGYQSMHLHETRDQLAILCCCEETPPIFATKAPPAPQVRCPLIRKSWPMEVLPPVSGAMRVTPKETSPPMHNDDGIEHCIRLPVWRWRRDRHGDHGDGTKLGGQPRQNCGAHDEKKGQGVHQTYECRGQERSSEGRNGGGRYFAALTESFLVEPICTLVRWGSKMVADGCPGRRQ